MKTRALCVLLLLTLALASFPAQAESPLHSPFPTAPYTEQGPFVVEPAKFLSAIPYQAGFIVGVGLCLPVAIAQDAKSHGKLSDQNAATLVCGRWAGLGLGYPVYLAGGLPFFILKQMFWDFPRFVLRIK